MSKTKRNSVLICFALFIALTLTITVYAFIMASIDIKGELSMGTINVELKSDSKQNIIVNAMNMEPGQIAAEKFKVENVGTDDFYFDVYFENITGDTNLAEAIIVKFLDDNGDILKESALNDFTEDNKLVGKKILSSNNSTSLTMHFLFPEQSGNLLQQKGIDFDITVEAIQSKNNPRE